MLGLDVKRTDRTLVFYEKDENLSKLWDILAVYSWFDKDVGYCQGQLLSDFLVLLGFTYNKGFHRAGLNIVNRIRNCDLGSIWM